MQWLEHFLTERVTLFGSNYAMWEVIAGVVIVALILFVWANSKPRA